MSNQWKTIGGFVLGATAGVIAGLLTAPSSGRATRKMIADRTESIKNDLTSSLEETAQTTKEKYNDRVENYAVNGKSLLESVKESMKLS